MITKGGKELKLEVENTGDANKNLENLKILAEKKIDEQIEAEMEIFFREVMIFSAMSSAAIGQAMYFKPLLNHGAASDMNLYQKNTEKLVKFLEKKAIEKHGQKIEDALELMEECKFTVYQKFVDSIRNGKLEQFMKVINEFNEK